MFMIAVWAPTSGRIAVRSVQYVIACLAIEHSKQA
jgi:hypothetical protein